MKNHVVLIIVLFLLVLVTANCTSSNNSELLYIDEKGIIHIEIEKILDNNELKRKQFNLSEIADSITYIKLGSMNASGEEKFLRDIRNVVFTDDNIVVNDFNTVLLFDKKGNFIRQIGRRGQGPGEYLWVHGTAVDGNNRKIYIGNETKAVVYDFDNNFINSFPVKEEFNRMQFIENGKLLINRTNMYGALENKLSLIDSMGNILKSYPNYYNFTPQANMVIMVGESNVNKNFYTTTEGILYKGEYSDSIYSFDEDYNLKPAILLHLGKYTVPLHLKPEYLADPDKIQTECNDCYNTFTTKTDKYFIVECRPPNSSNSQLKLVICNRVDQKCVYTDQAIVNDIDNGPDIIPSGITSDGNYLYTWMSCSGFIKLANKKKSSSPSLNAFIKGVGEDDNLVMIMIKLK